MFGRRHKNLQVCGGRTDTLAEYANLIASFSDKTSTISCVEGDRKDRVARELVPGGPGDVVEVRSDLFNGHSVRSIARVGKGESRVEGEFPVVREGDGCGDHWVGCRVAWRVVFWRVALQSTGTIYEGFGGDVGVRHGGICNLGGGGGWCPGFVGPIHIWCAG